MMYPTHMALNDQLATEGSTISRHGTKLWNPESPRL